MNLPYLSPNNFWLIAGVLIGAGFTVLGVYVEHRLQIRRDRLKAKAEAEAAEEEKREAIRFAFLAGKNGNVTVRMITEEEGLKTHDLFFLMSDKGVSPNNEQVLKAKEIARATVQRGERGMTESKPSEQYFYQTANNGSPSASNDELTDQSTAETYAERGSRDGQNVIVYRQTESGPITVCIYHNKQKYITTSK